MPRQLGVDDAVPVEKLLFCNRYLADLSALHILARQLINTMKRDAASCGELVHGLRALRHDDGVPLIVMPCGKHWQAASPSLLPL